MPFHKSVIKLSNEYVDTAVALLQRDGMDEESIHEIRVLMKRLRGLLRLYKAAGEQETVNQLNPVLRDVARAFAAQRDSHVLSQTLQSLAQSATKTVASNLRSILQELNQQTDAALADLASEQLVNDLRQVRQHWRQFEAVDESVLLDALAQSYRRNRKQGREALRERDQETLHDWRKRVKYLYYQLCALPTVDEHLQSDRERLRKLGSLLGKIHDLDVLADYVAVGGHENDDVARAIAKRRIRLMKKVRRLYRQIFSRTGREFRKEIEVV